jgi:hypothetical protein
MVTTFTEIYDHMMSADPKHRRMMVNSARHRGLVAKAMMGLASLSMQENTAKTAFFYKIMNEFKDIHLKKANPTNDTDFPGFIDGAMADMKRRMADLLNLNLDPAPQAPAVNPAPQEPAVKTLEGRHILFVLCCLFVCLLWLGEFVTCG